MMKRAFTALFLIALAVMVADIILSAASVPNIRFDFLHSTNNIWRFCHADFNGDGEDEVIEHNARKTEYGAFLLEGEAKPWHEHKMFEHLITGIEVGDIDNDGAMDIIELSRGLETDSIWCTVRRWEDMSELCRTEAVGGVDLNDKSPDYPGWDGAFGEALVADLEGDGTNELLLSVSAGHDLRPRGIMAFDYPSGELLWFCAMGGPPCCLTAVHVDSDSLIDIFCGTFAPSNRAVANDISDTAGYVIRVSHAGQIVWKEQTTVPFVGSSIRITDLDGDHQYELYTCSLIGNARSPENAIIIERLDLATGNTLRRFLRKSPMATDLFTGVLTDDGRRALITGRGITILDKNLNGIREKDLPGHQVFAVSDITGDGIDEIFTFKQDTVFIFDNTLCEMTAYKSTKNSDIGKASLYDAASNVYFGASPQKYIYLYDGRSGSNTNRVVWLKVTYGALGIGERVLIALCSYGQVRLALAALTSLFLGGMLFASTRRVIQEPERHQVPAVIADLLTSLTAFNHGQMAAANLNRLAFLTKNIPKDEHVLQNLSGSLADSLATFRQYTQRHLHDLTTHLSRASLEDVDTETISELSQTLERELQVLDNGGVPQLELHGGRLKETVPSIIENLRQRIKNARLAIREYFRTNVVNEIDLVLRSMKPQFDQDGMALPSVSVRGDLTASAFFDSVEFSAVIEELLSNARRAMASSPKKEISIDVYLGSDVEIRIADTGSGIEKEDQPRIFDRGFSTRGDEGGYGLYYVRNSVQKYEGSIVLEKSVPFDQTMILIRLVRVDERVRQAATADH
jgi:signal transduction histidine kinase